MRMATKGYGIAVALLIGSTMCTAQVKPTSVEPATHYIKQYTIIDQEASGCSATAIGPQALLTASHCEEPTTAIYVDGVMAKIAKIERDDNDHSIYFISDMVFEHRVEVVQEFRFEPGRKVYLFGNPDGMFEVYREGYMAQEFEMNLVTKAIWYDVNTWFGDSGAGIFDESGKVIGVVSFMRNQNSVRLMGGIELAFTPEQLNDAVTYSTPQLVKKRLSILEQLFKAFGK